MSELQHDRIAAKITAEWRQELPDDVLIPKLESISDYVRRDAFETIRTVGSGHIGGSSSSVELLTSMYFGGRFNFDIEDPQNPNRDQILIRGHEGPVRYPIFALLGFVDRDELPTYRHLGSRLQGHEDMSKLDGVDITPSGSLGMLLSYGVGAAVVNKNEGYEGRIISFLGDGEEQEGNVSEAARHAASMGLDNLICIIDSNKKQLTRPTAEVDSETDIRKTWEGYGWDVLEIEDGNDVTQVLQAYDAVQGIERPTLIIANTIKGNGVRGAAEHPNGYHTLKSTDRGALDDAIDELNGRLTPEDNATIQSNARLLVSEPRDRTTRRSYDSSAYDIEYDGPASLNIQSARDLYFRQLRERMAGGTAPLYMISPDFVRTDTQAKEGYDEFTHFYNVGIREQHAIAMAHGIATTQPDAKIFVHYWDFVSYRALDQMNAAAQAGSNMVVNAGDAGIFHSNNGRTHISTGQPGALLSIPEVNMYEPADPTDLFNVYSHAFTADDGFTYVRLHAGTVDGLERESADAKNINAYTVFRPDAPAKLSIFSSGAFVQNSIEAAKLLELQYGTPIEVVNVVNQKGITQEASHLFHDGLPVLAVYNGSPAVLQSSIGKAVMERVDIERPSYVAGHGIIEGTSGFMKELERHFELDAEGIAGTVLKTLTSRKAR